MNLSRLGLVISLLSLVIVVGSCKKEPDAPASRPQKKKKRKLRSDAHTVPKKDPLTAKEKSAIANQWLLEAMKTRKAPFDRVVAAQDVIFEKYGINVKTIFSEKALKDVVSGGDLRYLFRDLKNAEEVRGILEDEAAKEVEPNWSGERLKKVKKSADEKFKHYKLQEVIEAKVSMPGGRVRTVRGRLEAITSKAVFVGGQRILLKELIEPPRWAFDKSAIRKKRNSYVYNGYTRPKSEEKNAVKERLAPEIYKTHGCIKRNKKWISIKRLLIKEVEPEIDRYEDAHDDREKKRFMREVYERMQREGMLDE